MRSPIAHPARDLLLAISTLTVLPVRMSWPAREHTDAPGYYPLVGIGLGGLAYGVVKLSDTFGWAGRAPLVVAAGVVALFALATRMLHWDGLADVADSLGAATPERRLEIMKDSATGAFGVTAIVIGVVVQTAAIALLLQGDRAWGLVAVPAFGRLAATFAAWFGRPARAEGLGASVIGKPDVGALLPLALTLAAIVYWNVLAWGAGGVWLSVGGVALALGAPHLIGLRFGGVTGDVMGASVVLVETVLFAALAVML